MSKIKKVIMSIVTALVFVVTFAFVGCGKTETPQTPSNNNNNNQQQQIDDGSITIAGGKKFTYPHDSYEATPYEYLTKADYLNKNGEKVDKDDEDIVIAACAICNWCLENGNYEEAIGDMLKAEGNIRYDITITLDAIDEDDLEPDKNEEDYAYDFRDAYREEYENDDAWIDASEKNRDFSGVFYRTTETEDIVVGIYRYDNEVIIIVFHCNRGEFAQFVNDHESH